MLVEGAVAITFFCTDENQYYWILHGLWHWFVYASSLFAFWINLGNLSILVLCGRYPKGLLWPGNFWAIRQEDDPQVELWPLTSSDS